MSNVVDRAVGFIATFYLLVLYCSWVHGVTSLLVLDCSDVTLTSASAGGVRMHPLDFGNDDVICCSLINTLNYFSLAPSALAITTPSLKHQKSLKCSCFCPQRAKN